MEPLDYKHPAYDAIALKRTEWLEKLRVQPVTLAGVLEYYKTHPADFINDWGMTFDPRNAEIGLPTTIPFVLFQRQTEFIEWLHAHWLGRKDGLAEKSRDMGVSWLCIGFGVWMWRFHAGTVVGFGSRKEEYVDKIGDPKALFWKARLFIELLPHEFKPAGYDAQRHAPHMRIINPENDSAIVGEAGDNIGRGNRTSIYFKDESAFYEHPDAIDAALSQTSNCKIDVSTPNGNGNPFFRKRHSGKIDVFSFHWTQDPRKDQAWYMDQKNRLDPVIVAQEIDIDYNASVADAWINGELITKAQLTGPADLHDDSGQWIIGVDAAHFGDDESVISPRKGRLSLPQICLRKVDGPQLARRIESVCDDLSDAGDYIFAIVIELDGPGVSCYDQLMLGRWAEQVQGIHTGVTQEDDKNYNLRALMWRQARDYLLKPPVSMPNEAELRSQLSSLKYKYKDGLLLMQNKKEYKTEFGRSPDRADGWVLTHAVSDIESGRQSKPSKRGGGSRSWQSA